MNKLRLLTLSILTFSLAMATTQPAQTPAQAPAQTFEGGDVAMVRVAHLSPNTPSVNIVLLQDDGTVGTAGEQIGEQTGVVQEAPAATEEAATQEQAVQEPATEEPMTQAPADAGVIEIVINPPEADDAIISIAGPDGFEDTFTGEQTLTDLVPGTYVLNATREGFEAASEEFEVGAGETARVEVTFVEAAGDEAATQRQAAQPMTAAQEQQFAEREQRVAAQQPAVQEGLPGLDTLQNLSYEDVTDYVPVLAGNYIVQVQTADDSALAYEGTLNLTAGAYYTVAAIGFALETEEGIQPTTETATGQTGQGFFDWLGGLFGGQGDAPTPDDVNLRLQVYDDQPGSFPDAGNANVRVIHASAGSPEVDLVSSRGDMPATAQPETQAAATPAATTQEPAATTEQPAGDTGVLEMTVTPAEAEGAVITVVGPDGYEETFTGPQTVSDLVPGTYLISATHEDYEAVSQEVQVEAGQTATVELNLQGDEGATQDQEEQTQEGAATAETATTEQPAADAGMLEIVINPPEAGDAIVSIVGPDGFQDEFSGAETVTDLVPGTYGLNATREGFEAASEEFEVNAGETVRVEITFVEIAGDEAAAQRQAAQPLTPEQEQQFAQRQQALTTQPGVVQDPVVQDPVVQDPAVQDPAVQDPAIADPLVTDPVATDPALEEQVVAGGLAYGASSGYQAVRALEEQNLMLRVAGADPGETILDLSDVEIQPGHVYTIFITGTTFEDYPLSYIMVTDASLGGGTGETNGGN